MKADAHPVTPLPQLDIPAWVPDAIAQYVGARYTADVDRAYQSAFRESGYFDHEDEYDVPREYRDQLIRDDVDLRERITELVHDDLANITWHYRPLVADRQMKNVWRELSRHNSNGGFHHRAIGIDQDAAMIELFDTALACRTQIKTTTTKAAVDQQRDRYLAKAKELRDDVVEVFIASPPDQRSERYQHLQATAQAYEDLANEIYATSRPMALERKHDFRGRWVALTIGNKFRSIFDKSMYRLSATITSVVLGREIKFSTVRLWLETKT